ncbi:MAG: LysM peptidoglycan-binding domain-containing protein [Bacteroidales bacterium]|nr:LysM peptidoglycan-binding domain-containing protein [Bacteroidales bacterium]
MLYRIIQPLKTGILFVFLVLFTQNKYSQFEPDKDMLFYHRIQSIDPQLQLPPQTLLKDYVNKYVHSEKTATTQALQVFFYYQPYIKQTLVKDSLPELLQYLPLALSRMQLTYQGTYHTAGIWALPVFVAVKYGLVVNDCIDERMNVMKSTQAAINYLRDLYYLYGNFWEVLLAYTEGPSGLNAIQIRTKNTVANPWDLYNSGWLKHKEIIPNFIAYTYLANYHDLYNLNVPSYQPIQITCIQLSKPAYFHDLFNCLNISKDEFQNINPCYMSSLLLPNIPINIPTDKKALFAMNEDSLYLKYAIEQVRLDSIAQEKIRQANEIKTITYTVKNGDYLGKIAHKYNVSVANIKKWNHLKSDKINVGQRLMIHPK